LCNEMRGVERQAPRTGLARTGEARLRLAGPGRHLGKARRVVEQLGNERLGLAGTVEL